MIFFNRLKVFITISLASMLFSSCGELFSPTFDEPVKHFFEEYTNSAAIEQETLPQGTETPAGILCVSSSGNAEVTFILRNPQQYKLNFAYEFNSPEVSAKAQELTAAGYTVYTFTQSTDTYSGKLNFSKDFLYSIDESNAGKKDISGYITITEPKSGRSFASYPVSFHANSAPPSVQGVCFQRSSESDGATYIVCFYMPDTGSSVMALHKEDTHTVYINGVKKYTKDGQIYTSASKDEDGNWVISDSDPDFSTSVSSMYPLSEESSAFSFNASKCPSGYTALYYDTGWPVTTDTKTCTITIEDDDGLTSTMVISNNASQLKSAEIRETADTAYDADEDSFRYTLHISHDGMCTDETFSGGNVTINYTVEEVNGNNVFNGGSSSSLTGNSLNTADISVPKGKYKITATSSKNYYISGESVSVTGVSVKQPAVFYVSESGTDRSDYSGSKTESYRTINYAIDMFTDGITYSQYESDSSCTVYVMSDLTPPSDYNFSSNSGTFVNIPAISNSISIIGYGGTRTIDAQQKGSVMIVSLSNPATLTLENISLKGGLIENSSDLNASAVYVNGNTVMKGGTISDCTSTADRKGIVYVALSPFTMENVTITSNTSSGTEGYIIKAVNNPLTLKNCTVTGNTSELGAVTMGSGGTINIKGTNIITKNTLSDGTARNVYLPEGKTLSVTQSLEGSKIGIYMPFTDSTKPSSGRAVTFTEGFSSSGTEAKPGAVFITETEFAVTTDGSGEAAFAVSSGTLYTPQDYSFSFTLNDSQNRTSNFTVNTGAASAFTLTPAVTRNSETVSYSEISSNITWTSSLYCSGTKVCDCSVTKTETGISITVPALSFEETYTLKVCAEYLGLSHDAEWNFTAVSE